MVEMNANPNQSSIDPKGDRHHSEEPMVRRKSNHNNNYGTVNAVNGQSVNTSDTAIELNEVAVETNGTNHSSHPRLSLRFSDEVISREDSIYTLRSDGIGSDIRYESNNSCWFMDPKIRSHRKVFLSAFCLLIIGVILVVMGIVVIMFPEIGFQSYVFFIAGIICLIPGAYHVVYVYFAVKGRKGYDLHQLPLFN